MSKIVIDSHANSDFLDSTIQLFRAAMVSGYKLLILFSRAVKLTH